MLYAQRSGSISESATHLNGRRQAGPLAAAGGTSLLPVPGPSHQSPLHLRHGLVDLSLLKTTKDIIMKAVHSGFIYCSICLLVL